MTRLTRPVPARATSTWTPPTLRESAPGIGAVNESWLAIVSARLVPVLRHRQLAVGAGGHREELRVLEDRREHRVDARFHHFLAADGVVLLVLEEVALEQRERLGLVPELRVNRREIVRRAHQAFVRRRDLERLLAVQ